MEGTLRSSDFYSTSVLAVTTGIGEGAKSTWLVSVEAEDCVIEAVRLVSEQVALPVSNETPVPQDNDICQGLVHEAVAAEFRRTLGNHARLGLVRSKEIFLDLSSDEAQAWPYFVLTGQAGASTQWLVVTEAEDCVVESVELVASE